MFPPAAKAILSCPAATLLADTPLGGDGEPTTTNADAADASPAPRMLVAVTRQTYVRAVVSPGTVRGLAVPLTEPAAPPSLELHAAVKLVMALPLLVPGVKLTVNGPVVAFDVPGRAFTLVGAPGAPTTAGAEGVDAGPVPRAFLAVTVHP